MSTRLPVLSLRESAARVKRLRSSVPTRLAFSQAAHRRVNTFHKTCIVRLRLRPLHYGSAYGSATSAVLQSAADSGKTSSENQQKRTAVDGSILIQGMLR